MGIFGDWILPPLVGAVIGYFTNWLAIKMLFRPLREYRVLGLRLPFTPGVLPRERSRIARSIGDTVARELLTEAVVRRRLSEPDIREALVTGIARRLDSVFSSRAAGLIPARDSATGPLARLVAGAWDSLVSSEAFRAALEEASRRALVEAEEIPLSRFLPPAGARDFAGLLLSPRNVESLRASLGARLDAVYAESGGEAEANAAPLVPPEAVEPVLAAIVEGLYRAALPAVELFLREPEVKALIGRHANRILRNAVTRLNLFQRLIVGAAQYERRLVEGMPETVDDLIASVMDILRGPQMARRAAGAAATAFRRAAAEPFRTTLRGLVTRETARSALDSACEALAANGPAAVERAAAWASSKSGTSLAAAVRSLGLPADEIASRTAAAVSRALALSGGAEDASKLLRASLSAFLAGLETGLGDESLGEAIGADEALRSELAAFLADKALEMVIDEAGRIVAGLDLRRIVVERIDELDLREVERIVLDVVGRELLWITALGGVLGGAIGLIQALLTQLVG